MIDNGWTQQIEITDRLQPRRTGQGPHGGAFVMVPPAKAVRSLALDDGAVVDDILRGDQRQAEIVDGVAIPGRPPDGSTVVISPPPPSNMF